MNFKKRVKKLFLCSLGIFLLLFLFRFTYGYFKYPNGSEYYTVESDSRWNRSNSFLNIASSKYKYKSSSTKSQIVQVDQKFEKTANLNCRTDNFVEDEKKIRSTIKSQNAIIQFQQKSGNEGNQKLNLQIGVPPEAFDSFIEEIKSNQKVLTLSMTKKDKTNEYRE